MASIADLINPLSWAEKLGGLAATLVVLAGAGWYVDHRLEKHYTAKATAEVHAQYEAARKDAAVLQGKSAAKALEGFKTSQVSANKVLDYRLTEIATYAKKLPPTTACLADAEFVRLYNNSGGAR